MIHPNTELAFISTEIGYGVIATKEIPAGTITWIRDKIDREFTPKEIESLEDLYQDILDTYTFRIRNGNSILCWDIGKYINHSFKPNCIATAYDFEIAVKDIQVGEQLTNDYGFLNISEPFRAAKEGTRRKVVYPDDLKRYYKRWDSKVKKVFSRITEVDQALKPVLPQSTFERIERIVSGEEEMLSILYNFYDEKSSQMTEDLNKKRK